MSKRCHWSSKPHKANVGLKWSFATFNWDSIEIMIFFKKPFYLTYKLGEFTVKKTAWHHCLLESINQIKVFLWIMQDNQTLIVTV